MIQLIISLTAMFVWLLYETDWLKVNLMPDLSLRVNLYERLLQAGKQCIKFDGVETKPRAVRINKGVYNLGILKELARLIPDNAKVYLLEEIDYRVYEGEQNWPPHRASQGCLALHCRWDNGSRASWNLRSGYKVYRYSLNYNNRITAMTYGYGYCHHDDIAEHPNDILLAVDLPILKGANQ